MIHHKFRAFCSLGLLRGFIFIASVLGFNVCGGCKVFGCSRKSLSKDLLVARLFSVVHNVVAK